MAVLDRIPVERINAEARQLHAGRMLLTLIAAFFFAIGWVVAKLWLAVAWSLTAVKVGFEEGRKPSTNREGG